MSEPAVTTNHWPPRRIVAGTFVVCAVAGVFALLVLVRHVLFLLFIAIVLSTALAPLVALMTRRGVPRNLAISLVFTLLLVVLVAPGVIGLPLLVEQGQSLLHSMPESYEEFRQKIGQISPTIAAQLPEQPAWVHREDEVIESALTTMSKALSYSGLLLHGGFLVLVVILMSFLWSIHEERTIRSMLLFLPPERRAEAGEVIEGIESKVGAYIRGQGLLCLAVGTMSLVAYLMIGLPHALARRCWREFSRPCRCLGRCWALCRPFWWPCRLTRRRSCGSWLARSPFSSPRTTCSCRGLWTARWASMPSSRCWPSPALARSRALPARCWPFPWRPSFNCSWTVTSWGPKALEPERPAYPDAVGRLRFETQELIKHVRLQMREKDDPMSSRSDRVEEAIETIAQKLDEALASQAPAADAAVTAEAAP